MYQYSDPRDRVLFSETPTVMQPRFGPPLPPPEDHKHRFLCGDDGLYIEAQNAVIGIRMRIAPSSLPLPYGKIERTGIHLRHGLIPSVLFNEALAKSRAAVPNEWAGFIVWDEKNEQYALYEPDVLATGPGQIHYLASFPDKLTPVIDLHSHGNLPAFFSSTDDHSDLAGFYVAGIIGNCGSAQPSFAARMVVNGHFLPCLDLRTFFV
jgi:PRTRC genetic system protein A